MKQPIFNLFPALALLLVFQYAGAQGLSLGVRGGVLLNNWEVKPQSSDNPDFKNTLGLQGALVAEIGFGSFFAIQPELMYGSHGARYDETTNETDFGITYTGYSKGKFQVNTLEIPVLLKLKLGPENIKFHVLAGPSFGFGINGKFETEYALKGSSGGVVLFDESGKDTYDAVFVKDGYDPDDVKETEFGVSKTNLNLHLGAGLNFKAGGMTIFLDGRYILGVSDLIPDEKDTLSDEKVEAKSTRLSFSAGILFPLGGGDDDF